MLVVTNTVEALSPQVTTKTDIYSIGTLALRLMLSTNTPHSQRAMSTLLLYYYQSKQLPEGRVKGHLKKGLVVDKAAVEKILKVYHIYMCI